MTVATGRCSYNIIAREIIPWVSKYKYGHHNAHMMVRRRGETPKGETKRWIRGCHQKKCIHRATSIARENSKKKSIFIFIFGQMIEHQVLFHLSKFGNNIFIFLRSFPGPLKWRDKAVPQGAGFGSLKSVWAQMKNETYFQGSERAHFLVKRSQRPPGGGIRPLLTDMPWTQRALLVSDRR